MPSFDSFCVFEWLPDNAWLGRQKQLTGICANHGGARRMLARHDCTTYATQAGADARGLAAALDKHLRPAARPGELTDLSLPRRMTKTSSVQCANQLHGGMVRRAAR